MKQFKESGSFVRLRGLSCPPQRFGNIVFAKSPEWTQSLSSEPGQQAAADCSGFLADLESSFSAALQMKNPNEATRRRRTMRPNEIQMKLPLNEPADHEDHRRHSPSNPPIGTVNQRCSLSNFWTF